MGEFPITQAQWQAVMGNNPSEFRDDENLPVEMVSWDDAKSFCARLSAICGRRVHLPTEAEWEYACRAGSTSEFFWGEDEARAVEYAWFDCNSGDRTHPVGMKKPNPWGFYDLVGNVWEWCEDHWHSDYCGAPSCADAWTHPTQDRRVLRGGAWDMDVFRCRSSYRSFDWRSLATSRFGMRIVIDVDEQEIEAS